MKHKYVLAIGELLVDTITNVQVDDLSQAKYLNIHPGGSASNFCRYLSRCGTDSRLVASVGNDGFGKILLDKILLDGLSTAHISKVNDHNTSLIVVGRNSKTPDFIPYRDADRYITDVDKELISNASLLHTTAFSLSKDPAQTTIVEAFSEAHNQNIPVSVDWNYSEKIWASFDDGKRVFNQLQDYSPLLKFSMDDICRFLGQRLSIQDALNFLSSVNANLVCLTCGAEGVFYRSAQVEWRYLPAAKIVVENATGAGDAFWAGLIHAWVEQKEVEECVQEGINTASNKLQGKLKRTVESHIK